MIDDRVYSGVACGYVFEAVDVLQCKCDIAKCDLGRFVLEARAVLVAEDELVLVVGKVLREQDFRI